MQPVGTIRLLCAASSERSGIYRVLCLPRDRACSTLAVYKDTKGFDVTMSSMGDCLDHVFNHHTHHQARSLRLSHGWVYPHQKWTSCTSCVENPLQMIRSRATFSIRDCKSKSNGLWRPCSKAIFQSRWRLCSLHVCVAFPTIRIVLVMRLIYMAMTGLQIGAAPDQRVFTDSCSRH